ncbi:MAG: DUF2804 domain-containing protein [Pseudomonadota bacterium]|nr:DUF2804 domain-containing protein [Pseudomonadota bacterium]
MTNADYNKLIKPDGQPQYGRYQTSFQAINRQDFEYLDPMDRPAGRLRRYFHFNQFHFLALHGNHFTLACAIANVRYVASAFVYLFDHQGHQLTSHRFTQPLGWRCHLSPHPFAGLSRFHTRGAHFEILGRSDPVRYELSIRIGSQVAVDASLDAGTAPAPTVVCTPTGFSGWSYTEKHYHLPVNGYIQWQGRTLPLTEDCQAVSDWSCGYMRRETAWNWASISGPLDQETQLGLNLACGVNETSFSENTLWLNGVSQSLGPARFQFNRRNRLAPWQITTADHKVALNFVPIAHYRDRMDRLWLATNFCQLAGHYHGTVYDHHNQPHAVNGILGLAEDHYARW